MKTREITPLLFLVGTAMSLGACDDNSSNESSSNGYDDGFGVAYEPLQGTWETPCFDDDGQATKVTREFESSLLYLTVSRHDDGSCSNQAELVNEYLYSYEVGEEVVTEDGTVAQQLSLRLREGGEEGVVALNAQSTDAFDLFRIDDVQGFASFASRTVPFDREPSILFGTISWCLTGCDGRGWSRSDNPHEFAADMQINAVHYSSPLHGVAVGEPRQGSGRQWVVRNTPNAPWEANEANTEEELALVINQDVHMTSDGIGWAVGADGLGRTGDQGRTWEARGDEAMWGLEGVHFNEDGSRGWAVGHDTIWRTRDGGETWDEMELDTSESPLWLADVHFPNDSHGWAVGNGQILHSANGGLTWDQQLSPSRVFEAVHFTTANIGWAVAESGWVYHTTDGGQNWESRQLQPIRDLTGVHFYDVEHGWIVGHQGAIFYTSDAGVNWEDQGGSVDGYAIPTLNDVFGYGPTNAVAVGIGGAIYSH